MPKNKRKAQAQARRTQRREAKRATKRVQTAKRMGTRAQFSNPAIRAAWQGRKKGRAVKANTELRERKRLFERLRHSWGITQTDDRAA